MVRELKLVIGLGVSHHARSRLCYWIMTANCDIISRTIVHHLTEDIVAQEDIQY